MGGRGRGNVKVYIDGDPSGLGRATKQAETYLGRLGSGVTRAGDKMAAAGSTLNRSVTLPVLAVGAVAGKTAIDFDKSMRNVNSIAQLPEPRLKALEQRVLNLAGPTAQAPRTLAEGLYDLVSSGFDADDSLKVLDKSARAATAGLTTTEVSTAAMAAVLNAYHLKADKAGVTSDRLFETVNRGVISFEDLASNIGDVLPFASSLGVGLDQVGASIATMTKQGISAPETMTRIKNVMVTLLKPGEDLRGVLDDLGVSGEELVRRKGLQGALETLIAQTDGSKEAIGELFPNIRALGGVLALTGGNARSAAGDLAAFSSTTGATEKALSEQEKSTAFKWQRFRSELEETAIEVAPEFLDAGKEIVGTLADMVGWFDKLSPSTKSAIIQVGLLSAALGPLLTISGNLLKVVGGTIRLAGRYTSFARGVSGAAAASTVASGSAATGGVITGAGRGGPGGMRSTYDLARSFGRGRLPSMAAAAFSTSFATGLAPALAALGIGNIVTSVIDGDMRDAGFKGGGALAGGIAGAFFGPAGAMIGAGIGSVVGGLAEDAFGALFDSEKKIPPLQAKLASSSEGLARALGAEREALQGLVVSSREEQAARRRQGQAARRVEVAERQLVQIRRQHKSGTFPVIEAELKLARARTAEARASDRAREAEKKHGFELKLAKITIRGALLEARHRINVLGKERDALRKQGQALAKWGGSEKEIAEWQKRNLRNSRELAKARGQEARVLQDASAQVGVKWARNLERASTAQLQLVNRTLQSGGTMKQHYREMAEAVFGFSRATGSSAGKVEDAGKRMAKAPAQVKASARRNLKAASDSYKDAAEASTGALGLLGTRTNTFLGAIGAKPADFDFKARGGAIRRPMIIAGEEAPRHHEWMIATNPAYRSQNVGYWMQAGHDLGIPGFAKGGELTRPRVTGPEQLRSVGQAPVDRGYKAVRVYVDKQRAKQASASTGGVAGYVGPPPSFKQLGDNAWVDSHTMTVARWLSSKFGVPITDGWRPQNAGYGAANSSHKRGTPDNPGAFDFGTSYPLLNFAKKHIAGLTEAMIHDYGFGLHTHLAFFKKGGLLGGELQQRANRIWDSAAPYFRRSPDSPMPRTWAAGALPGGRWHTPQFEDGSRSTYIGKGGAKALLAGDNRAEKDLIHEWAHYHQRGNLNKMLKDGRSWMVEGGAEAFAGWAAPGIYASAGLPYSDPGRGYPGRVRRVLAEKGWDWVKRGQFGFARGGKIDWSKLVGSSWDNDELATLAHIVGMKNPGLMAQIAQGESSGDAGAVGQDPGGTEGLGLWQITTGYNDDLIEKYGGRDAMLNPWPNAKAAKEILDRQGLGAWYAPPTGERGTVDKDLAKQIRDAMAGKDVVTDPDKVPTHGRKRLSYDEKASKLDTRIARAETTAGFKDDRRAAVAKLDLLRGRKRYLEKRVSGINKKLKGKLKPPVRDRLLSQRESFLSELASMPGEASSLIESLREGGVGQAKLKKHARGFGIGTADPNAEKATARDRADLQLARAERTGGQEDDLVALERIVDVSKAELKAAKKTKDPRRIAEATRNLKAATDAVDELRKAIEESKPTAKDFATRDLAMAELTEGLDDDRAALERLKQIAQEELDAALRTADPRDDIEAAGNLKSATEALKALEASIAEQNELQRQREEFERERLEVDKRLANLAETQGPALAAAMLAWFDGAMGGPLQTRARLATAGVSAGYQ